MKHAEQWKPTMITVNGSGDFILNKNAVYPGSVHVATLQWNAYKPILQKFASGKLLDCGCGLVPYYQVTQPKVSLHYCVDRNNEESVARFLDEHVDLNSSFVLKENNFDSVLLTDVIAHIKYPAELLKTISHHMAINGHLILTTPFVYWMSGYPNEFFHPTEFALRSMCEDAGLEAIHLESYGGRADVLLDTLNKGMSSGFRHRVFRLLASVLKNSGWYRRSNEKSRYSYALGYTLVARKL